MPDAGTVEPLEETLLAAGEAKPAGGAHLANRYAHKANRW